MITYTPDLVSAFWGKERSATLMYILTVRLIPILEMLKKMTKTEYISKFRSYAI